MNINGTRLKDTNWHATESWQDQEQNSGPEHSARNLFFLICLIIAVKYINRI